MWSSKLHMIGQSFAVKCNSEILDKYSKTRKKLSGGGYVLNISIINYNKINTFKVI